MGEFKPDFEFRLTHSLQSLRSELIQDIAKQQQRLVSELRGEITTAFKSEAAAIAALDEQLWLTDQRLGQRIDDVAHAQGMHLSRRQHDDFTSSTAHIGAAKASSLAEDEDAVK